MEKKKNRKEYTKVEYLPVKLTLKLQKDIINDKALQNPTKNNFLQCVSIIFYHQVTQGFGINNYVPLGRNYWHKVYGGNYHKSVIEPLLTKYKIIESHDFKNRTFPNDTMPNLKVKQGGTVDIRYRINPDLLDDQFQAIPYITKGKALTAIERMELDKQEFILAGIPDMNYHVSIDHNKASQWVESNAEIICTEFLKRDYIEAIPEGLKIECREHINKSGRWSYYINYLSVGKAKAIAQEHHKELFYFKNAFYIGDVQEFIKQRVLTLKYHYKHQISQIGILPIEEKRNPVTLRLYSHLTNFPSKILQFININNKTVVQLDLRTSQFLIFANLLNVYLSRGEQFLLSKFKQEKNVAYLKKLIGILKIHQPQLPEVSVDISDSNSGQFSLSDVTKFIRDVFFTDFYEVVQKDLGLQERLLAKHVLFKLLFKKTNRADDLLSQLSKRYPVVMSIIAEFKKPDAESKKRNEQEHDRERNFSVFLQCVEGEIFVDNILKKLRDEGIPCFTRHDSMVVASGYEERSEEIAKQVFKDFGFKYNHKVEDKFWEAVDDDELEFSDYMQWLIDENELNQEFYIDESQEDPIINEYEENYDMDEGHLEIIKRLKEIGIRDDYYGIVEDEFLEEISELPFLTVKQRNILYDDINNLREGFCFLQDNTNELLRRLLSRNDGILGIP